MQPSRERIDAIQRMQDYIMANHGRPITLPQLARAACYSPWHALRAFSEHTGQSPQAYIRAVRLSAAARRLRDTKEGILDIALASGFDSQEGFTKAFSRAFGITPGRYRKLAPPIPLFSYYSARSYYRFFEKGEEKMPGKVVFTQLEERPARRLILKRGREADEYFAYCGEVGCDVWGVLESVKGALYESVGLWLPRALVPPGTGTYCQGVEMPADYAGPVPEGFEMIDLPACTYLVFRGEPFRDEDFQEAIGEVWEAIEKYDPQPLGWKWAPGAGPRFQYAPTGSRGYIEGRPVEKLA